MRQVGTSNPGVDEALLVPSSVPQSLVPSRGFFIVPHANDAFALRSS